MPLPRVTVYRNVQRGLYYLAYRDPHTGKRIRTSSGCHRKREADNIAEVYRQKLAAGIDPRLPVPPQESDQQPLPILRDAVEIFLQEYRNKDGKIPRSGYYRAQMAFWLKSEIAERHLDSITSEDLKSLQRARASGGRSDSSLRKDAVLWNTFFRFWQARGVRPDNPAVGLPRPTEPDPEDRWLTVEEENRFLQEIEPWLRDIVNFAFATGLRRGEIISLSWKDIGPDSLYTYTHKGGRKIGRHIPLSKRMRGILGRQVRHINRQPSDPVFGDRDGKPYTADYIGRTVREEQDRLDLRDTRGQPVRGLHIARHTFCARLVMAGVPLETVSQLAGHRSVQTTRRYAHLSPTHLADALAVLNESGNKTTTQPSDGTKKQRVSDTASHL